LAFGNWELKIKNYRLKIEVKKQQHMFRELKQPQLQGSMALIELQGNQGRIIQ
jgi:hypothetical protein